PDEVWRQVWELNFLSAVRLFRAVVPHMEKRGGGSFVAISSISGLEAFGRASYVAAKSALHGFAKAASIEVASRGIRVNCVAPGAIWFPGGSWDWRQKNDPETFRSEKHTSELQSRENIVCRLLPEKKKNTN